MSPGSPNSGLSIPPNVDGIGLMRTEFLFQGREQLPTEEEQYQIYRRMVEWAAGKPVTIRTLDAGGDKPIAGLTRAGRHQSISRRARRAAVAAGVSTSFACSCGRWPARRSPEISR